MISCDSMSHEEIPRNPATLTPTYAVFYEQGGEGVSALH